jgi:large repetitive protein
MKNIILVLIILVFNLKLTAQQGIVWSTYFGGSDDEGTFKVANLENGSTVLAGNTLSTDLATAGSYQTVIGGSFDGILALLDPYGHIVWCTYFGGAGYDYLTDIAISPDGNIWIVGYTDSAEGISNAGFQMQYGGEVDAFVAEFSPNGTLLWSSYIGGTLGEEGNAIAVDLEGAVYVAGETASNNLAIGAVQMTEHSTGNNADCFLMKIENNIPTWCTYYGGTGTDIILDITCFGNEKINIVGSTESTTGIASSNSFQETLQTNKSPFLAQFSNLGLMIWGTYWGQNTEFIEDSSIDSDGNIYVGGYATQGSAVATIGAFKENLSGVGDAFLTKFNTMGMPQWCTYYGGDSPYTESINCVKTDGENTYIGGVVSSTSGIATTGALTAIAPDNGTQSDGFIAKFDSAGNRLWGTYLGSHGFDILTSLCVQNGKITSAVYTGGLDWQTTQGLQENSGGGFFDCAIVKIDEAVSVPALKNTQFNIYPNPVGETLFLSLPEVCGISRIEILDANLQITNLIPIKFTQSNIEIPVSNLSAGVYFLRLISYNKYYNSIPFIKL